MKRRATDSGPLSAFYARWGAGLINLAAVIVAGWAVLATVGEGNARRDQTCVLFERQEKAAVDQLAQTYAYLERLSLRDRRQALNQAIIAQLPQVEANARSSAAPPYCDEAGVGLPEPNPRIPPRPPDLR